MPSIPGTTGFEYDYSLGLGPGGYEYGIGVAVRPDLNDVESFAALLFRSHDAGSLLEIARIDDTFHPTDPAPKHRSIHIHRWYRDVRLHERDYDIDVTTWWEADAYLESNFERFARRYHENHGDRIVADDRGEK